MIDSLDTFNLAAAAVADASMSTTTDLAGVVAVAVVGVAAVVVVVVGGAVVVVGVELFSPNVANRRAATAPLAV